MHRFIARAGHKIPKPRAHGYIRSSHRDFSRVEAGAALASRRVAHDVLRVQFAADLIQCSPNGAIAQRPLMHAPVAAAATARG